MWETGVFRCFAPALCRPSFSWTSCSLTGFNNKNVFCVFHRALARSFSARSLVLARIISHSSAGTQQLLPRELCVFSKKARYSEALWRALLPLCLTGNALDVKCFSWKLALEPNNSFQVIISLNGNYGPTSDYLLRTNGFPRRRICRKGQSFIIKTITIVKNGSF